MKLRLIEGAMVIALASCGVGDCRSDLDNFFALSADSWPKLIQQKPLARQYEIYLCGVRFFHPPPNGLAFEIAKGGDQVGDFAATKLKGASDPVETIAALNLLVEVSKRSAKVCGNPDTAALIEIKRNELTRRDYREYYDLIGSGYCKSPNVKL